MCSSHYSTPARLPERLLSDLALFMCPRAREKPLYQRRWHLQRHSRRVLHHQHPLRVGRYSQLHTLHQTSCVEAAEPPASGMESHSWWWSVMIACIVLWRIFDLERGFDLVQVLMLRRIITLTLHVHFWSLYCILLKYFLWYHYICLTICYVWLVAPFFGGCMLCLAKKGQS